MYNRPRLAAIQQCPHQRTIRNVPMHKLKPRALRNCSQVVQIPRVGEFVQVHDGGRIPLHPLQNEIGSDKTSSASNEDRVFHIVELSRFNRMRPWPTRSSLKEHQL